jgi:hypothetical protein
MSLIRRRRGVPTGNDRNGAGQTLVEFALVFPLFITLMLFIIEFAFVFSALLGVNYASRNGALIAAEGDHRGHSGHRPLSERTHSAPGAPRPAALDDTTGLQVAGDPAAKGPSAPLVVTRRLDRSVNLDLAT